MKRKHQVLIEVESIHQNGTILSDNYSQVQGARMLVSTHQVTVEANF